MLESWPSPPAQSMLSSWMEPLHTMLYMMLYHLVISVGAAVGSRVFGFHFWWHNVANGGIFASINGCEKKKAPASIGHMKRSLGTYIYIFMYKYIIIYIDLYIYIYIYRIPKHKNMWNVVRVCGCFQSSKTLKD